MDAGDGSSAVGAGRESAGGFGVMALLGEAVDHG